MVRKSPKLHKVQHYTKHSGTTVKDYVRGSGYSVAQKRVLKPTSTSLKLDLESAVKNYFKAFEDEYGEDFEGSIIKKGKSWVIKIKQDDPAAPSERVKEIVTLQANGSIKVLFESEDADGHHKRIDKYRSMAHYIEAKWIPEDYL